jgi:hypothetical protein
LKAANIDTVSLREFKLKDFLDLTKFELSFANAFITAFCYNYYAEMIDSFNIYDCGNVAIASLMMVIFVYLK